MDGRPADGSYFTNAVIATNFLRIIVGIFILDPHIKRTNAKILLLQQQQQCRSHDDDDHDTTSPVLY